MLSGGARIFTKRVQKYEEINTQRSQGIQHPLYIHNNMFNLVYTM